MVTSTASSGRPTASASSSRCWARVVSSSVVPTTTTSSAVTHRAGPQPGPLAAGPGVAHEGDLVRGGRVRAGRRGAPAWRRSARGDAATTPPSASITCAKDSASGMLGRTVDPVDVLLICCAAARKRVWSVSSSAEFNADRYCTSTSTPTSADSTTVTSAKHQGDPAAERARAESHDGHARCAAGIPLRGRSRSSRRPNGRSIFSRR